MFDMNHLIFSVVQLILKAYSFNTDFIRCKNVYLKSWYEFSVAKQEHTEQQQTTKISSIFRCHTSAESVVPALARLRNVLSQNLIQFMWRQRLNFVSVQADT